MSSECNSRQVVKIPTGDSDRIVPPSRCVSPVVHPVALTISGFLYHPFKQQAAQVCVFGLGSDSLESGPLMGGTECLHLSCVSWVR